jgi:hypothetical protein
MGVLARQLCWGHWAERSMARQQDAKYLALGRGSGRDDGVGLLTGSGSVREGAFAWEIERLLCP